MKTKVIVYNNMNEKRQKELTRLWETKMGNKSKSEIHLIRGGGLD